LDPQKLNTVKEKIQSHAWQTSTMELVEGPMQYQKGTPSIEEGESKEDIHGVYSCCLTNVAFLDPQLKAFHFLNQEREHI